MSPDPAARPRASVTGALTDGWRRVLGAPAILFGVPAILLICALLPALATRAAIQDGSIRLGIEQAWSDEFMAIRYHGTRSISRDVMGFGGSLAVVDDYARRPALGPAMRVALIVALALGVFLSGGIIDRLARGRRVELGHFAGVSAVFFLRFVRLAAMAGVAYWAIFRWLYPWLGADLSTTMRGVVHVLVLGLLALVAIILDFAQVRAVVEDRRSMIGALLASVRFVRRRAIRVLVLYALNAAAFALLLWLWRAVAAADVSLRWSLILALLYVLVRVFSRLALIGSSVVFFQQELAHARYTATPSLIWPDSPAAEAINNLRADDSR